MPASDFSNTVGEAHSVKPLENSCSGVFERRQLSSPIKEKESVPMATSASGHARQYHSEYRDMGYLESRFSKSPWEKSIRREANRAPVTLWAGISSVIVALEVPDIDSTDLDVSVTGNRLLFRGKSQNSRFCQDVDLPCAVELHPIHITKEEGILYVLLVKKQETEAEITDYPAKGQSLPQVGIASS